MLAKRLLPILILMLLDQAFPRFVQSNDISINSDFEGGNAELVSLDQATLTVRIMPAIREGSGWPCWWYFRADRLPVGETLVLEVQSQSGPYAGNRVLAANWCQPKHASISVDDKQWTLSTTAKMANGIARYLRNRMEYSPHDRRQLSGGR